jgi:hypothetical protein
MLPHPDFEKVAKAPALLFKLLIFACMLGLAILKDAILSIVIAVVRGNRHSINRWRVDAHSQTAARELDRTTFGTNCRSAPVPLIVKFVSDS